MNEDDLKKYLKEYLKEHLNIRIDSRCDHEYDYCSYPLTVCLYIDDELITDDTINLELD